MKYYDLNEYIKGIVKDDEKKKSPAKVPVRREEVCGKDSVGDYMNDRKVEELICHFENALRKQRSEINAELDYITSKIDWKNNRTNDAEVRELLKDYYSKHEIEHVIPKTAPIKCEDITAAAYDIFDR